MYQDCSQEGSPALHWDPPRIRAGPAALCHVHNLTWPNHLLPWVFVPVTAQYGAVVTLVPHNENVLGSNGGQGPFCIEFACSFCVCVDYLQKHAHLSVPQVNPWKRSQTVLDSGPPTPTEPSTEVLVFPANHIIQL